MKLSPWALLLIAVAGVVVALALYQRSEQQAKRENEIAKQAAESSPAAPKSEAAGGAERKTEAPGVSTKAKDARGLLSNLVLFDFDQSALRPGEAIKLDELADKLKSIGVARLDAVGHADRIGTDAYNHSLSERRAEAVKAYLLGKGLEPGVVRTHAKGEAEAVTGDACNNMHPQTPQNLKLIECLQPDRRVEIAVSGPG